MGNFISIKIKIVIIVSENVEILIFERSASDYRLVKK